MKKILERIKEWSPILWRCSILATLIGLILGIGSGVVLEMWQNLSTIEVGLIIAIFLWISSLFLAIYLTEMSIKRRLNRRNYALIKSSREKLKKLPANHNHRYYSAAH